MFFRSVKRVSYDISFMNLTILPDRVINGNEIAVAILNSSSKPSSMPMAGQCLEKTTFKHLC